MAWGEAGEGESLPEQQTQQEGSDEPFQGESLGGFATLVLADLKREGRREPVSSLGVGDSLAGKTDGRAGAVPSEQ